MSLPRVYIVAFSRADEGFVSREVPVTFRFSLYGAQDD